MLICSARLKKIWQLLKSWSIKKALHYVTKSCKIRRNIKHSNNWLARWSFRPPSRTLLCTILCRIKTLTNSNKILCSASKISNIPVNICTHRTNITCTLHNKISLLWTKHWILKLFRAKYSASHSWPLAPKCKTLSKPTTANLNATSVIKLPCHSTPPWVILKMALN